MGANHSRDRELTDSESDDDAEDVANDDGMTPPPRSPVASFRDSVSPVFPSDHLQYNIDAKLCSLSLGHRDKRAAQGPQKARLYRYVGGNMPKSQWCLAEKFASWEFAKDGEDEEDEEEEGPVNDKEETKSWFLLAGDKIRSRVGESLQAKFFAEQLRVDFVHYGVWALKFPSKEEYADFEMQFRNCLFENTFLLEATEENKLKVFGKDFVGWAKPEEADDSVWEDTQETFEVPPVSKPLKEDYVEPSKGGIQSVTMGALDHSFLVSSTGIEAVKNLPSGIHGKGVSVAFEGMEPTTSITPKKAMLIKGESNLMVLSPSKEGTPRSSKVHQVDVGTGKVVAQWKFQKDGTPVNTKDVTNDSKSSQLDSSGSTFLGLDDNSLCRWDMRDRHGIVQRLFDSSSPVLNWAEGHQFSRGTNFQCFATTGDGGVVVGSKDGKIRLYGTTSMRMAKTAFPGLGSPITHVDVTYDGKWVLATTDSFMILISTVFKDKNGKTITGFMGRMGNNIAAPRLLKLSPLDAHLAGKDHKFRGGQFSWVTESDRYERNLVASVGNFTVVWNFRRVKESSHECYRVTRGLKSCYCYRIIPKEESVVDSKFMHDNYSSASPNAPLVVATPKKVSCFNVNRD